VASKHTPEPWYVVPTWDAFLPSKYDPAERYDGPDREDIFFQVGNYDIPACSKEDAERIVECVNACDGIEDPEKALSKVRDILYNNKLDLQASGMFEAAADMTRCLKLLGGRR
jgi:hypothetical protein